jgi:geranylgeranyl pyrophosphate synthase
MEERSLTDYLSGVREQVDEALEELVAGLDGSDIRPQIEYALMSQGKRLRPIIVILSGGCIDAERDLMDLALAFELLHTATLVHDDIIDGDDMRRNRPALHVKWTLEDGILVGDALISLSVKLASSFGNEVIYRVSEAALELCEGEHMDITGTIPDSEDRYFEVIGKKSGALFRAAAECGALAGGAGPEEAGEFARFGQSFGIAYQLRDDLQDRDRFIESIALIERELGEYSKVARECILSLPESKYRRYLLEMTDILTSSGDA